MKSLKTTYYLHFSLLFIYPYKTVFVTFLFFLIKEMIIQELKAVFLETIRNKSYLLKRVVITQ